MSLYVYINKKKITILVFTKQCLFVNCFRKLRSENLRATIRCLRDLRGLESRLELIKIKVLTHICSSNLVLKKEDS